MNPNQKINYPTITPSDTVDNYHGTLVADPYRALEDADAETTKKWVEAENEITFKYLEQIPARKTIQNRLTQLWDYEKYSVPWKEGDRYFYFKNDGLQNQSVFYTLVSLDSEPEVLLDANQLSKDGTVALSGISISDNGKYLAYGLSTAGSDWQKWQIKDIETKQDLPDKLDWIKFSGAAWTPDSSGFYYSRYDEPATGSEFADTNYYQKLYYHKLGTCQSEDKLIYHRPDEKEWGFNASVTDDGRYLIISVWRGTESKNLVFYQDLFDSNGQVIELINEFEASYSFIDNQGSLFWLTTDLDAPKGKIVAIDIAGDRQFVDLIPEAEETLDGVNVLHHQFVTSYLKDAHSKVKIFYLTGQFIKEIELPGIGSVGGFKGKRHDTETFYSFTSFTTPNTIYSYNLVTSESTLFRQPKVDFKPEDYEIKQVFYPSKDGTQIPMFITHKRGLVLEGNNPTLLYGYGGFNVSLTPSFSVSLLVWMEMGGVYAVPNLRGGGEYGEEWHQAGIKSQKQNVFDDFISAAEWLIANGYTSTKKLAISGGSNGGLLVGACMTQRPDLFAAALPAVGVMDMLRFHKFTIGWAWTAEYGSPDNPDEFPVLYAYSPLHNLKSGTAYPATLITTAERDDRVVPAHSFKFAAALQAAHQGEVPVLIRIETKAGHGAGKPTTKMIEEAADKWAFLMFNLSK
ncbi:prolyl oligopeptidase family serine peptidase [Merismopedia glauca]|uniref:prolyl oligopeptidase n=1 Tax=Merismopedia glauca CCAP 1448/3 TaxID=1296344 RepID=A0A2T1C439_9CYAN|nr:prolyl oligopeptidase family serine peptidase [Merismopedia glauca]PSB03011.1 S9 family peptidase [Merismopedia glauca CCAP 1448/3]